MLLIQRELECLRLAAVKLKSRFPLGRVHNPSFVAQSPSFLVQNSSTWQKVAHLALRLAVAVPRRLCFARFFFYFVLCGENAQVHATGGPEPKVIFDNRFIILNTQFIIFNEKLIFLIGPEPKFESDVITGAYLDV